MKIIDCGAGDLGVEKIGSKPHLDAFQFAGVNDLLDSVELGVAGVDEDNVGRVFVHLAQEVVDRLAVDVELEHDAIARFVGVIDAV